MSVNMVRRFQMVIPPAKMKSNINLIVLSLVSVVLSKYKLVTTVIVTIHAQSCQLC